MSRAGLISLISIVIFTMLSGCGYTTHTLIDPKIKNIHIDDFVNKIPIAEETTTLRTYRTYHPRLELDITKAIIDKFLFDGYLKVTHKQNANVILEGELTDFRREVTKYGDDDEVEQYRIVIEVDMKLKDVENGKIMWQESGFAGTDLYYLTGAQAKSEDSAITDAIDDLARRVVERTVEAW